MGGLMESVKKAQAMVGEQAAQVQKELAAAEFEGYSDDETVKVVMSGNQEPRYCDITQAAMDEGAEGVSQRVTEAMIDSHTQSVTAMKDRMKRMATDLGIPSPMQ